MNGAQAVATIHHPSAHQTFAGAVRTARAAFADAEDVVVDGSHNSAFITQSRSNMAWFLRFFLNSRNYYLYSCMSSGGKSE